MHIMNPVWHERVPCGIFCVMKVEENRKIWHYIYDMGITSKDIAEGVGIIITG